MSRRHGGLAFICVVPGAGRPHLSVIELLDEPLKTGRKMHRAFHSIASALSTLRAAIAVASAAEAHRRPAASDLRRLGIDATKFASIHL
ncbi:hypothetical protein [Paracoccus thiocyanatus]|uniref:hypothetical protein n=1 Tax=Paracoccus thiocyanatus TaxID=34006 RepID=UPI0011C074B3|nr:hypothetical protein [Paracoccus thiocyanatus]